LIYYFSILLLLLLGSCNAEGGWLSSTSVILMVFETTISIIQIGFFKNQKTFCLLVLFLLCFTHRLMQPVTWRWSFRFIRNNLFLVVVLPPYWLLLLFFSFICTFLRLRPSLLLLLLFLLCLREREFPNGLIILRILLILRTIIAILMFISWFQRLLLGHLLLFTRRNTFPISAIHIILFLRILPWYLLSAPAIYFRSNSLPIKFLRYYNYSLPAWMRWSFLEKILLCFTLIAGLICISQLLLLFQRLLWHYFHRTAVSTAITARINVTAFDTAFTRLLLRG